jgi:hypothetical protein
MENIKYEDMTEEQQAHVDARNDAMSDDGRCICGKLLSDADPECYSHMTQGY